MSTESVTFLLQIMAVFTGVAAVAMVIQMLFLAGTFFAIRQLKNRSVEFMNRWEPLASSANKTLEDVRKQSTEILVNVKDIAATSKAQVGKVDSLVDDLSATARKQLERVDEAMATSLDNLRKTGDAYQEALLQPVHQLRGVAAAATAILDHLFGRRRSRVDRATQDEELFI